MYSMIGDAGHEPETVDPIAVRLADDSYAALDTQRVGRMGELVVEYELIRRGWIVGNFNASTMNSAGWDLFATRGSRSIRMRVKAKRPGVTCFRWSAKHDGTVLMGLTGADDDFVAAVSFDSVGGYEVFLVPSAVVEQVLVFENSRWLSGNKSDGGRRKPTTMRHIYMDDRSDDTPSHGFASKWARYRGAWPILDATAS